MNSKKIKSFLWGAAAAAVLFHSVPALAESFQTIEAIFGRVGLMVDGVKVEQETLLYDGTTYVPLRAAAEILGKEVNWNEKTNTADIISPVVEENLPKDEKLEEIEPEIIDNEDGDDDDFIQNEIEEELTYNMYDLKLPAEKDVYILKFLYRGKECVFSDGVIVRMHFYTDGSVRVEMKNNDEEFVRNSQPTITHISSGNELYIGNFSGGTEIIEKMEGELYAGDWSFNNNCKNYALDDNGWIRGYIALQRIEGEIVFDDGLHKCVFDVQDIFK